MKLKTFIDRYQPMLGYSAGMKAGTCLLIHPCQGGTLQRKTTINAVFKAGTVINGEKCFTRILPKDGLVAGPKCKNFIPAHVLISI